MRYLVALLCIGCVETDPPEIISLTPKNNALLHGAKTVVITAQVSDESKVTGEILVNGESIGAVTERSCDEHCTLVWEWDSSGVPEGRYGLQLVVGDEHGNDTEPFAHTVLVDDIITIKAVQVANVVDEEGALEIEVYLYNDSRGVVHGCAGGGQGLSGVDVANTRYMVSSTLVDVERKPVGSFELAQAVGHFEVWENDSSSSCPDGGRSSRVGFGPQLTMADLRGAPKPLMFDDVTELVVALERPFTLQEAPPPVPQQPDNNDDSPSGGGFGGGGCRTSRGNAGLALVLIAIARALRRSSGGARTSDRSRLS